MESQSSAAWCWPSVRKAMLKWQRAHRDLHPEDGVAVYRARMDEPTPVSYRLVDYFSSEFGEARHPGFAPHYQHGLLE